MSEEMRFDGPTAATPNWTVTALNTLSVPVRIDRKRYVELTQLAHETCQWLESKGLKKGEQCVFSRIAQELWFSE